MLGNYTKLSKYLIEHDKVYRATIKFGEKTETGDLEGKVIETSENRITDIEEIRKVFKQSIGKQLQVPPMYSAIKINGKKLYEYAREGKTIEVQPREIEIYKLELISFSEEEQEVQLEVSCSKGTYIRRLCEDLAEKLNTVGFMKELKRIKVDKFSINKAISFEDLENKKHNKEYLENHLIKMEELFNNYPIIDLNSKEKRLLLNGVIINVIDSFENGLYNIYSENEYIGLGIVKEHKLKRDIIIN